MPAVVTFKPKSQSTSAPDPRELEVTCTSCNLRETCLPGGVCLEDLEQVQNIVYARRRIKRGERLFGRVVAQSPIYQLSDYFGQTVQFPLDRAINVKKGQMIGLTVPTWAPALSTLTDDGSSWRASRALNTCDDTDRQTAQTSVGDLTQYRCLYKARLTYTATLITNPKPKKKPRKKKTSG